jgi:hypothetical protein
VDWDNPTFDVTHHTFNICFLPLVPWDMTKNYLKFLLVSLAFFVAQPYLFDLVTIELVVKNSLGYPY